MKSRPWTKDDVVFAIYGVILIIGMIIALVSKILNIW